MRTSALRPVSRALVLIVAAAFALRLGVVVAQHDRPYSGDELSYRDIALNLAAGNGYVSGRPGEVLRPTAARGPGYVLFVAAFYRVLGPDTRAPLVAQAALEAASVLLVYALARRWFRARSIALVAAGLYAFYPPFILITALLLTEPLTNFTILLAVWRFTAYLERRRMRDLVASAVALGVCALSKPQLAPIAMFLCLSSVGVLGRARALRSAAIATAVVVLVLAPWVVRNARVFHAFVPGVSTGGVGLWFGAGPIDGRTIGGVDDPRVPDSLRTLVSGMGELESSRWGMREARRVIAADPAHYVWLSAKKLMRLWFNVGFDDVPPSRASVAVALFNALAIALAFVGARKAAPTPPAARMLVHLALFWTVVNLPFFTVVRYAYPYYALLFPFTAAGITALVRPRDVSAPSVV